MFHLHHHCFTFIIFYKKSKFAKKNKHQLKNIKKSTNKHLQILHVWKSHNKNALCWVIFFFFFSVNDNKNVDVSCAQTMWCIFHYNSSILIPNQFFKFINEFILYNKWIGITLLHKYVNETILLLQKGSMKKLVTLWKEKWRGSQ
jgi:hypothetical protein